MTCSVCVFEDAAHHLKHHSCSYSSCHIESCREIEETCSQSCVHHDEDRSQGGHARGPAPVCLQMTVSIHAGALQQPRSFSRVNAPNTSPVLNIIVNRHGDRWGKALHLHTPKNWTLQKLWVKEKLVRDEWPAWMNCR